MPRPVDSGGPSHPRLSGCSRMAFGVREHPRRPQHAMSKLSQHFRACPGLDPGARGHPYGLQDSLSTLRPFCSPWSPPRLRHGRKTRYGWVANPYPTGTLTLQETPSFSWRDNAKAQPLLPAVGCSGKSGAAISKIAATTAATNQKPPIKRGSSPSDSVDGFCAVGLSTNSPIGGSKIIG